MLSDPRIAQAHLLIQQQRYTDAKRILKNILAEYPNDLVSLIFMAEISLQEDNYQEAGSFIDRAMVVDPTDSRLYYMKSRIALAQNNYSEARYFVGEAINADPTIAAYFTLQANIALVEKKYELALENADRALELDPENVGALNVRSTSLLKLNRKEESFQTIHGALREDPNNAYTHANYGWGLLEKGDHQKAKEHFKEALKIDPGFEHAQNGMKEALKASNLIYRLYLKYSFFMANLSSKYQWGIILGFYFGTRLLRTLAEKNPTLDKYLTPLIILLALFAISTWIMKPFGIMLLRINKYGKYMLNSKEKLCGNLVGISFLLFLVGLIGAIATNIEWYAALALFGFTMMVPLGNLASTSKYKYFYPAYAAGMALIGIGALALAFNGSLDNLLSFIYIIAFVGYQWISNIIIMKS